jgi:outer membrane protein
MTAGVSTSTTSLNDADWDNQIRNKFSASGGLGLSIPIFDQRKARTAVNKAKIQLLTAELDLRDKQKALWKSIEGFWLDAQTNQQKFRSALVSVESEQTSYDLLQEQFQLGLKNIVELMTGKDKLLKAQQNKLQSKYTTILNQQLLKFYQGEKMSIEN